MKQFLLYGFFLFFLSGSLVAQTVISMKVEGAINPVTADFIKEGIEKATQQKAACLLIELNTPGGLLKSTRNIVSYILESPVPVIVYISPAGSQAGSVGVFITLAAHIAAMTPGTNIGAAHPVTLQGQMDSIMSEKVTNDAAAFIRSIAEKRNRNIQWAENAVRRSFSYTETEALEDSAIDLIAVNVQDLLNKVDGKTILLFNGTQATLQTKTAVIEPLKMNFIQQFLHTISDPTIAYILLLLGFFGILFELFIPGAILPGVIGGISLILAYYAMHTLPINMAGLALILFALILFLLEIKVVSYGILAIGGVISLMIGSMMLIKSDSLLELVSISSTIIYGATAVIALFFLFIIAKGIKAQKRENVTGPSALIGRTGEVTETLSPTGIVLVNGELWNSESVSGTVAVGEKVRITEVRKLKLYVESITHT
ncbi:MAG TPA: nodulation protein NfeD [Chitinophagaceae bacterium]|nr:nodulation protein NfeD [Chitinophagaceae bacterium]HPH33202.1 nodulation protein NfeD [Chitinophagaceae bacterium]HPN59817.1 nodulation protein NfeD [Chitinophagaceae bacterium]